MPRYQININNSPFEFDWDKPNEPTDDEIISLYKLDKSGLRKPVVSGARNITPPVEKEPSTFGKVLDFVNKPLIPQIGDIAEGFGKSMAQPNLEDSKPFAMLKGALGGAIEGAGNFASQMTAPADLAATAFGVSPMKRVGAAIGGLRGGANIIQGTQEGDSGKMGAGALETGLSVLGAKATPRLTAKSKPGNIAPIVDTAVDSLDNIALPIKNIDPLENIKVNPIEGGLTTKDRAVRTPSLANEMYGIRDTGSDGFGSVPSRMKTGTNQIVMDALLPSSIKDKIKQGVKLSEPENIAKKAFESGVPEIQKAAVHLVDTSAPVNKAKPDAADLIAKKPANSDTSFGKALDPYVKSGLSILEKDSTAGKSISNLIQRTRIEGDKLAGNWSNRFKSIVNDLDENEWANFQKASEGVEVPFSNKVKSALEQYRLLDDEVANTATQSGMVLSDYDGNIVPFEPQKNYWPRIYGDDFIDSQRQNAFDELIAGGESPESANAILEASKKFGNRLISPQHKRQADVSGYRTDKEAYLLHLDQMGKRIAESKMLGPRDLGDSASPLSTLVAQTRDKAYVTDILERHLGRKKPDAGMFASDKWAGKANSLAAATDLGLFAISNQAQKATIPIRGDLGAFAKAVTKYKTKEGKAFAEKSGALQTALRDSIQELGGEHWVNRLYRMGASERSNRTLASLTGKFTAEGDFVRLKANPKDRTARSRLKDLLLLDDEKSLDNILKQEFLNEDQLYTSGSRMAEMTQGRAGSIDLPPKWRSSPEARLMTMYKGYAFRQTKAMKDAFLSEPGKFLAVGLPLLAITGEAVGDAKAAVRGAFDKDKSSAEAISSRGEGNVVDKILKSANTPEKQRVLAARVIENLSEAWTLGILGDLIGSSGENPTGLLKFIAGPVPGMAADMAFGGAQTVMKGDIKPFASHTVKNLVPAPLGYPLSKVVKGKEKSTAKPKMMPRLPSVGSF